MRKKGSSGTARGLVAAASMAALAVAVPADRGVAAPAAPWEAQPHCAAGRIPGAYDAEPVADAAACAPTGGGQGAAQGPTTGAGPALAETARTAAERHGWGPPLRRWSDEFDYGSASKPAVPDPDKWKPAGGGAARCWPGHAGNGRRCDKNTRVYGGVLRQTGEANGDSGWLASRYGQRYGRWEARVRSEGVGENNGRQYHPLLILWPDSERWPQDGEYDYLENGAPGEKCAEAFLHYPHDPDVPVQQKFARKCGVDLSAWHNIAIEWTPDHVRGFVDGVQWYSFSGGANADRECIQCAPSMHQTIQLDNFYGSGLQGAVYEVDWARVYPYSPDSP
ncbi:glycoside hydrolase family 16 protein [Streptomyces buecherae]|uniref:glycoside hydrolase family 16 protein n=1 Tax=Streptomyces buecherae TaxID=2763006 RepID=UPI001C27677E|nr:glycoside hydrolase family 16 protein [Streptomyces buecherae]